MLAYRLDNLRIEFPVAVIVGVGFHPDTPNVVVLAAGFVGFVVQNHDGRIVRRVLEHVGVPEVVDFLDVGLIK